MDFQFRRHDNGQNNISIATIAIYTPGEFQALAQSGAAVQPCISRINPYIQMLTVATIYNPTFLQLSDPGVLMEGFTEYWANEFQNTFNYWYGDTIRKNLAPILQWFRRETHRQLEQQRDSYFGASPSLPYSPQYRLPRP